MVALNFERSRIRPSFGRRLGFFMFHDVAPVLIGAAGIFIGVGVFSALVYIFLFGSARLVYGTVGLLMTIEVVSLLADWKARR